MKIASFIQPFISCAKRVAEAAADLNGFQITERIISAVLIVTLLAPFILTGQLLEISAAPRKRLAEPKVKMPEVLLEKPLPYSFTKTNLKTPTLDISNFVEFVEKEEPTLLGSLWQSVASLFGAEEEAATKVETAANTASPVPQNANFSDNFDDNSRFADFWSLYQISPVASQVFERNGQLEIDAVRDPNHTTYAGYQSNNSYSVIGSTLTAQVVNPTTANGGGGNSAFFGFKDTRFRIAFNWGFIDYDNSRFNYDPTKDKWVRIRDDAASGTVYFESSPNGTNWEVRATLPLSASERAYYQTVQAPIQLWNGTFKGWDSKDIVKFDNFSYTNVANSG